MTIKPSVFLSIYSILFLTYSMAENDILKVPITVFVHGTRKIITPLITIPLSVGNDLPSGLHHIEEDLYETRDLIMARSLAQVSSDTFNKNYFYLFAWHGELNRDMRKVEAQKLHEALNALSVDLKNKIGSEVELQATVIAHSHGCNMALNIAHAEGKRYYTIENLILLAPPVQHWTQDLVNDSLFKKVFSFYSTLDHMQVGEPQKWVCGIPQFSGRIFESPKVKNIQVNKKRYYGIRLPVLHQDFLKPSFLHNLANFIKQADQCNYKEKFHFTVTLE